MIVMMILLCAVMRIDEEGALSLAVPSAAMFRGTVRTRTEIGDNKMSLFEAWAQDEIA
jgi:hypothetical protein